MKNHRDLDSDLKNLKKFYEIKISKYNIKRPKIVKIFFKFDHINLYIIIKYQTCLS